MKALDADHLAYQLHLLCDTSHCILYLCFRLLPSSVLCAQRRAKSIKDSPSFPQKPSFSIALPLQSHCMLDSALAHPY